MSGKKRGQQQNQQGRPKPDAPRMKAPQPAVAAPAAAGAGKKGNVALWALMLVLVFVLGVVLWKQLNPVKPEPMPPQKDLVEKEWQSLVDGERIMGSVKRLLAIGPRVAGTDGSKQARAMIRAEMMAAGVSDIREQTFTDETPKTTATPEGKATFTNVIAVLPGKQPEGIAIAAHYDSKHMDDFRFVGANDAASAVACLFEIARKLKPGAAERDLTYYFVFFDGEEAFNFDWSKWEREEDKIDNTYGSRYFERRMDDEGYGGIKALVLLDLCGDKDYSLSESPEFSPEMLQIFRKASTDHFGIDVFVQRHSNIGDDHDAFSGRMPVMNLIDFEYGPGNAYWHTAEDTIDKLGVRSLERTGTLVMKALPEIEKMVLDAVKVGKAATRPK